MTASGPRASRLTAAAVWLALFAAPAAAQIPDPAPVVADPAAVPATAPTADAAKPADPPKPADGSKFEASWKNGLNFQSKDKTFTYHIGGLFQYDAAWYDAPPALRFPNGPGDFADGTTPRRGRIRAEGTMYKNVDFILEIEFFNGYVADAIDRTTGNLSNTVSPTEAFVTLRDVKYLGDVRIGNQKEPYSLEHMNSARYLEFLERSFLFDASPTSAFNNARNPGISAFRTWADDRVFTHGGVFKSVGSTINQPFGYGLGDGQYAATGRIVGLPVWHPDDQMYWSVGGAASHRDPQDDKVRFRVRDSVRSAPGPLLNTLATTPVITAESIDLYNFETAAVCGRWTLQAEYQAIVVNGASVDKKPPLAADPCFQGFYTEVFCFLTGESRPWDPKLARFNRVIPLKNLGEDGWGAWEVGVRYNTINLSNSGIDGGRLRDVTVGLNWYWNPNLKVQFNYDYTYRDLGPNAVAKGGIHAFGTRVAIDF